MNKTTHIYLWLLASAIFGRHISNSFFVA